jgi:hypothetical protein
MNITRSTGTHRGLKISGSRSLGRVVALKVEEPLPLTLDNKPEQASPIQKPIPTIGEN